MELNINSPAYYTNQNGVIDEIYTMCKEISNYVKPNKYSPVVDVVGITPIIAPKEVLAEGLFSEEIVCKIKYRFASVSMQIDYENFVKGDINEKKIMIIENILYSMKSISPKARINFAEFNKDITQYCRQVGIMC